MTHDAAETVWEAYKTFLYSTIDVTATRFTARIGQEYFHIHSLQSSSNNNNYLNSFIKNGIAINTPTNIASHQ